MTFLAREKTYLLVGQEHYSVPKVAIPELKIDPLKIVFIKF